MLDVIEMISTMQTAFENYKNADDLDDIDRDDFPIVVMMHYITSDIDSATLVAGQFTGRFLGNITDWLTDDNTDGEQVEYHPLLHKAFGYHNDTKYEQCFNLLTAYLQGEALKTPDNVYLAFLIRATVCPFSGSSHCTEQTVSDLVQAAKIYLSKES